MRGYMKKLQVLLCFTLVSAMVLMAFIPVQADPGDGPYTMHFAYACTNNYPPDAASSLGQFSVDIYDRSTVVDGPRAGFMFYNMGPYQSSITQIYFQDGSLLGIAEVNDGYGTDYSQGGSPKDLPSGNTCPTPFVADKGFLATPEPPTQPNGVNNSVTGPFEAVEIVFSLTAPFDNVIGELNSGELRIGIHVQGYDSGGSESFVTGPGTAIKLDSFSATASHSRVALRWTTGTEIDNAGFNLYRASSPEGQRVKVNSGLISAAAGSVSGASYSVADSPGYGSYFYWLEDVSTGGAATLHGPVNVTLAPAFRLPNYRPVLPGS